MCRLTLPPTSTLYIVLRCGRAVKLKLPPSPVLVDCAGSETGYGDSEDSRRTVTGTLLGRTTPLIVSAWSKRTRRVSGPRSETSTLGRAGCVAVRAVVAACLAGEAPPQPATSTHAMVAADRLIRQR